MACCLHLSLPELRAALDHALRGPDPFVVLGPFVNHINTICREAAGLSDALKLALFRDALDFAAEDNVIAALCCPLVAALPHTDLLLTVLCTFQRQTSWTLPRASDIFQERHKAVPNDSLRPNLSPWPVDIADFLRQMFCLASDTELATFWPSDLPCPFATAPVPTPALRRVDSPAVPAVVTVEGETSVARSSGSSPCPVASNPPTPICQLNAPDDVDPEPTARTDSERDELALSQTPPCPKRPPSPPKTDRPCKRIRASACELSAEARAICNRVGPPRRGVSSGAKAPKTVQPPREGKSKEPPRIPLPGVPTVPKLLLPDVAPDNAGFFEPLKSSQSRDPAEQYRRSALDETLRALFPRPRTFTDPRAYLLLKPAPPLDPADRTLDPCLNCSLHPDLCVPVAGSKRCYFCFHKHGTCTWALGRPQLGRILDLLRGNAVAYRSGWLSTPHVSNVCESMFATLESMNSIRDQYDLARANWRRQQEQLADLLAHAAATRPDLARHLAPEVLLEEALNISSSQPHVLDTFDFASPTPSSSRRDAPATSGFLWRACDDE